MPSRPHLVGKFEEVGALAIVLVRDEDVLGAAPLQHPAEMRLIDGEVCVQYEQ